MIYTKKMGRGTLKVRGVDNYIAQGGGEGRESLVWGAGGEWGVIK